MIFLILSLSAAFLYYQKSPKVNSNTHVVTTNDNTDFNPIKITHGNAPKGIDANLRAGDNSILRLIRSVEVELGDDNPIGVGSISVGAYYLSENPITNQQFVAFLNANLDKIEVIESGVFFDGQLVLRLSEKIRGYKPIIYDGIRFGVQYPMHSSCAILLVTGYGADAYAKYYQLRLITAREWYSVMLESKPKSNPRMPLPTPVINYAQDENGLRAINQLAEWGKNDDGNFIILGQSPSDMIESELILKKTQQNTIRIPAFASQRIYSLIDLDHNP